MATLQQMKDREGRTEDLDSETNMENDSAGGQGQGQVQGQGQGPHGEICRLCRTEGGGDRPLFHPCICAGSIKWIHQECLVQWIRYSRRERCEVCGHRFSFAPIYSPDMPHRLPLRDVAGGLLSSVVAAAKEWCHYTFVALAWLGFVPLFSYRIYRLMFSEDADSFFRLFFDLFHLNDVAKDVFSGCFVVTCTLFAFLCLFWLREQIVHGGGPDWLERENAPDPAPAPAPAAAPAPARAPADPPRQAAPHPAPDRDRTGPAGDAEPEAGAEIGPEAEAEADIEGDVDGEGEALAGDEANWNPMEWDRGAEELTWERLLGLDGSMVFLEHCFWVVSLNGFFILVFAFCPYYMGVVGVAALGLRERVEASHFRGILTTLVGYEAIGIGLALLHALAGVAGLRRPRRVLGLCYVVVKVSLLSVVEIGAVPLVCGWWLDACSLGLFDASLRDREASLAAAPWTSTFVHWLVGMIYVYYFASFVLLLREVLRPGVLWFLKNLNDPDFSPIQEMIHLPVVRHLHSMVVSAVTFGTVVLLVLWIPSKILRRFLPGFLPYAVAAQTDAPVNELSLELLLLQVILPALLEQSHARSSLKSLVRRWCSAAATLLGLRSYLIGDEGPPAEAGADGNAAAAGRRGRERDEEGEPFGRGLGDAHVALLQRAVGPTGYRPYERPSAFGLRLAALLLCAAVSLVIASSIALVVPVWVGREAMALWFPKVSGGFHELYTAACGTYICWVVFRALALAASWLPRGRAVIVNKLKLWGRLGVRSAIACAALFGVVPLLFGLLLELVLVVPLRVPLDQTPILFVWQDWALGVLYTKIACAITIMGPECAMRAAIEKAYRDGIRNMDLTFILSELAAPVVVCFGMALAVPYALAHGVVPLFVSGPQLRNLIARRLYPFLLLTALIGCVVVFQVKQFNKLYEHIKNEKYLVGQRLVNYDHRRHKTKNNGNVAATVEN